MRDVLSCSGDPCQVAWVLLQYRGQGTIPDCRDLGTVQHVSLLPRSSPPQTLATVDPWLSRHKLNSVSIFVQQQLTKWNQLGDQIKLQCTRVQKLLLAFERGKPTPTDSVDFPECLCLLQSADVYRVWKESNCCKMGTTVYFSEIAVSSNRKWNTLPHRVYVCCLLTLNAEDLKQRSVINKHRNTVRASMPALRLKISTTL